MKKSFILAMAVVMTLCSFDFKSLFGSKSSSSATTTTTTTTTTVAENSEGRAAGSALRALYAQYKADGKYDYTNLSNIMNTMSLLQNCKNLKTNAKDSDYWKSFATGLVLGSENLVTEQLSSTVTNSLSALMENVDTEKLESASNNAVAAAATAKSTASSISNLLSLFQ